MEMSKSPHQCRIRNEGAVICQLSQTMPSQESSRKPVPAFVPQQQPRRLVPTSPLCCWCHSFIFWASSRAKLVLWVPPSVLKWLSFAQYQQNNVLVGIWILTQVLTFASCLAVTCTVLAFLAAVAEAVQIHCISSVLCNNRLEPELTSEVFHVGLNFASNLACT